ncbi:diguanylate cyclase domain protein, partial [Vibrio parahaemolyticus VPTS-2010]
HSEHQGVSNEQ